MSPRTVVNRSRPETATTTAAAIPIAESITLSSRAVASVPYSTDIHGDRRLAAKLHRAPHRRAARLRSGARPLPSRRPRILLLPLDLAGPARGHPHARSGGYVGCHPSELPHPDRNKSDSRARSVITARGQGL